MNLTNVSNCIYCVYHDRDATKVYPIRCKLTKERYTDGEACIHCCDKFLGNETYRALESMRHNYEVNYDHI